MGSAGKAVNRSYRVVDHAGYLDAWFDGLDLCRNVILVVHDWGCALGFYWAQRHPERVKGLVYMEALVQPVTWQEWAGKARSIFQALRSPAGEELVLPKDVLVHRIPPGSLTRPVREEETAG